MNSDASWSALVQQAIELSRVHGKPEPLSALVQQAVELSKAHGKPEPLRFRSAAGWPFPVPVSQLQMFKTFLAALGRAPDQSNWRKIEHAVDEAFFAAFRRRRRRRGRPPRWSSRDELKLRQDVEEAQAAGMTPAEAFQALARRPEYRKFGGRVRGPAARTLQERWKRLRRRDMPSE